MQTGEKLQQVWRERQRVFLTVDEALKGKDKRQCNESVFNTRNSGQGVGILQQIRSQRFEFAAQDKRESAEFFAEIFGAD